MNLHRVVLRCSLLSLSVLALHPFCASAQVRPRVTEVVDNAQRVTLRGNVHPLARAELDRGAVSDAQAMNRILLLLKRGDEQEAALETMLQNQQDKSSPSYHQWLTPEQFGAQFGPADADIQVVTAWLTAQGFSINRVYSGKTVIEFSGSAGQVRQAFGTAIHNYEVNGKTYSANTSDPQIPAALAPVVAGLVSLHNFPRQFYSHRYGKVRRSDGKNVLEALDPLVTVPNQNFFAVGPGDFTKIYGVPATCGPSSAACSGVGQTIAIVGETNFNVGDVQQFRSIFGLPANFDGTNIVYNGEDPGITSTDEEGEALLDTQWSGGVAPGATVKFVLSASTSASQGVDLSALYIVEHNLAAVMSESYGACEADLGLAENSFVNSLWQQASAQGITVAVSTGDSGSAGCDDPHSEGLAANPVAVNGLASTVYNVAVGGTDFDEYGRTSNFWSNTNNATTGTSALGYIPEIPWNQSCAQLGAMGCNINTTPPMLQNIVATGGGPSTQYNRASWQVGTPGTLSSDGKRDLPDVSLLASPGFNGSGYFYCQTDNGSACNVASGFTSVYSFGVIGGTSASAPSFAGIMALVNQSQATGQNPAPRQGNANYILYALANKSGAYGANCASDKPPASTCVFNDVTAGSSALPTGQGPAVAGTNSVPCSVGVIGCRATAGSQIGVLETTGGATPTLDWTAGEGYDMASGLGTLNVGNLISDWGSVSTVPTTTTLTLSPTTGITHGSEHVTATIAVTPKTATGTVSLIATPSAGTQVGAGQFTLGTSGNVSGTVANLPGGSNYQVYAHYSGDGTNAPSDSAPVSVTVAPEKSQTFIVIPQFDPVSGNLLNANATTLTYGSSYIIRMYVTNASAAANPGGAPNGACAQNATAACPSGTIALTANGNPVDAGTYHLDSIGYTRDLTPAVGGGSYTLAASYSGDGSYESSTASETFTVNPAPTTLTQPVVLGTALVGIPAEITTSVESWAYTGVPPTGSVTFYDGNTLMTGTLAQNPTQPNSLTPARVDVRFATTFAAVGNHVITAKYSGDSNYSSATSPASNPAAVLYPTTFSQSVSSTNINFGQSVTATATVSSQNKVPPLTGQIQIGEYQATITNVVTTTGVDGNGNQYLTTTATVTPGSTGVITFYYAGDSNYEGAGGQSNFINVFIPDFTMSPGNGLSVAPTAGQAGSGQLTITPQSQIPSIVTLQLPTVIPLAGYTVTLSPQTVNLNGSPVTVALNLNPVTGTSGTALKGQIHRAGIVPAGRGGWWSLSLISGLAIFFLLAYPGRRKRIRAALGLGVVGLVCFAIGCGGGGGSSSGGGGGGAPNATSVTLTTSNSKVALNGQLSVVATIIGGKNVTGTITFYDYGSPLAAGFAVSPAQPSIQIGTNYLWFPGVHQLTARYSGDSNNLASTSSPLTETITGTVPVTIQGATGSDVHSIQVSVGVE